MATTVSIGGKDYPTYADVDYADEYLAADLARASAWEAVVADDKKRALVSATRLLQRLSWKAGPPAVETATEPVKQATALLAADIAARPQMGDGASTGSNIKAVGAGSARVEFFSPTQGAVLPAHLLGLLRDMLGSPDELDGVGDAVSFGSHDWQRSRFDDFGLRGGDGEGYLDERRELW